MVDLFIGITLFAVSIEVIFGGLIKAKKLEIAARTEQLKRP